MLHPFVHFMQEIQFSLIPKTEAPGILLTQPNTNPTGQMVLQKGLYKANELAIVTAASTHPIK
jgi:hypothetical protein